MRYGPKRFLCSVWPHVWGKYGESIHSGNVIEQYQCVRCGELKTKTWSLYDDR